MNTIDAITLKEKLRNTAGTEQAPLLLDVREPAECAICKIEDSIMIPLDELRYRMEELDSNRDIVIICHHGLRSMRAGMMLENAGFKYISNLSGGIDAWATLVDPSLTKY